MLKESHIIKAGGTHWIEPIYKTKYIDLVIGEYKKLRFYNCGNGSFNVYLCNLETNIEPNCQIQLTVIETVSKLKSLLRLLYDKEGVELYNELLSEKRDALNNLKYQ